MHHFDDFIAAIQANWPSSDPRQRATAPCPSAAVLKRLADVIFIASLKTEEKRRLQFAVALADSADKRGRVSPTGLMRHPGCTVKFSEPRPFTHNELLRLAPATDHRQVMIGVEESAVPGHDGLTIWGLLDAGSSWWRLGVHEAVVGTPPPATLVLSTTEPGMIVATRGSQQLAVFKDEQLAPPTMRVFTSGPIGAFIADGQSRLHADACGRLHRDRWSDEHQDEDHPRRAYIHALARVLHRIAGFGHGGAVLMVPRRFTVTDPHLTQRIALKYTLNDERLRELALADLLGYNRYYERYFSAWDSEQPITVDAFREFGWLLLDRDMARDWLTDLLRFTSLLAGVDGAVVMNDDLTILGFGAEVIATAASLRTVLIAHDAEGRDGTPVSIENFGTRHRSAFRFCASVEDGLAFVLSQDGGVKAVKRVGENVVMWPSIQLG